MSEQPTSAHGQLRTLAVRISEDLRAQLDVVGQITGRSTTEEIRLALEHWIEKTKADPATKQKAEKIRKDIEREAQTRRNAISAIFGASETTPNDGVAKKPPAKTATNSGGESSEKE